MKTKNFKKKLALNKKTVVNLKIDEMAGIHGGEKGHFEAPVIPIYNPTITGAPCIAC